MRLGVDWAFGHVRLVHGHVRVVAIGRDGTPPPGVEFLRALGSQSGVSV